MYFSIIYFSIRHESVEIVWSEGISDGSVLRLLSFPKLSREMFSHKKDQKHCFFCQRIVAFPRYTKNPLYKSWTFIICMERDSTGTYSFTHLLTHDRKKSYHSLTHVQNNPQFLLTPAYSYISWMHCSVIPHWCTVLLSLSDVLHFSVICQWCISLKCYLSVLYWTLVLSVSDELHLSVICQWCIAL